MPRAHPLAFAAHALSRPRWLQNFSHEVGGLLRAPRLEQEAVHAVPDELRQCHGTCGDNRQRVPSGIQRHEALQFRSTRVKELLANSERQRVVRISEISSEMQAFCDSQLLA